jgi:hypothetical protein
MARSIVLAAALLLVSACDAVTIWFVPDVTCAGWQKLGQEQRLSVAEQIIRADRLFEGVQIAQHVPPGTPRDQLVAMAAGSITKNCDLQRWSPEVRVRELARDLYASRDVSQVPSRDIARR